MRDFFEAIKNKVRLNSWGKKLKTPAFHDRLAKHARIYALFVAFMYRDRYNPMQYAACTSIVFMANILFKVMCIYQGVGGF
jgi:hypothetical protein